jgi:hypothetical protein
MGFNGEVADHQTPSLYSQMTTTTKEEFSFLARYFMLRSEGLFMTSLDSLEKQQSRRVLKRSALSFLIDGLREGRFFVKFLAHLPNFLNGCAK